MYISRKKSSSTPCGTVANREITPGDIFARSREFYKVLNEVVRNISKRKESEMLQEIWNHEITVGDYVKTCAVSAAIGAVVTGAAYVYGKVQLKKQLKRIDEAIIEEK